MSIKFTDPKGQRHDVDLQQFNNFFKQEHDERRPTQEVPQGFQPSTAFGQMSQRLQAVRMAHNNYLRDKIDNGKTVTKEDIQNAFDIEASSILSSSDPQGTRGLSSGRNTYQAKMAKLNNGGDWKNTQLQADAAGVLDGSRAETTVSINHFSL